MLGSIWNHPFRRDITGYVVCIDDKGNIINLPQTGGLFDQDEDEVWYLLWIQDEVRKALVEQMSKARSG
jgi:hypothetical protein